MILKLKGQIDETCNASLIAASVDLINILEASKGNFDEMIACFCNVLEIVKGFKESIEFQKKQSARGRDQITEMMFDRAELLYRNIRELAKFSEIQEDGKIVQLFKIDWNKRDVEEAKYELQSFVNTILESLVNMKNEGATADSMDNFFEDKVDMVNILNCYADIHKCHIKALKPRNEKLADNKEYFRWDEVAGWSGGEKHAIRMAMFITLNTHVRKKRFSRENSWKFLVADNPFGEASADHVVKPMITLAKATNTQLFCLTGINDMRIQMEFDSVISNQYVKQRGSLVMHSESIEKDSVELEALFYAK
jgi:hypothetical protein